MAQRGRRRRAGSAHSGHGIRDRRQHTALRSSGSISLRVRRRVSAPGSASSSASMRHDAIVIGAGIVGAACALALARDGMRVLVLDSGYSAGGTTAAGMGHLVVMDDSPAQLALTKMSVALWRELAPELPSDIEHEQCGTIWVATDES